MNVLNLPFSSIFTDEVQPQVPKTLRRTENFIYIDLLNNMYIVYAEGTNYDMRSDGSKAWVMRFPHVVKNCPGNDKDLKYLQAIIDHLEQDDGADINNMGACGHSNGGFFTLSLAEVWSDIFKGFASVGSYTNYAPDLTMIDCTEPYVNGIVPSMSPVHNLQINPNPTPTLFIFGDMETVITQPAYESDCNTFSYFQNSVYQLSIKNRSESPDCTNHNFMTDYSRQIFKAENGGVDTHIQLYAGTHSWPADANTYVAEFFADLLYP